MAPSAEKGVVDSQLRVYGINGLRVCDASIFPTIISGHTVGVLLVAHCCELIATQAGAVFAIAEKLANELKTELLLSVSREPQRVPADTMYQADM